MWYEELEVKKNLNDHCLAELQKLSDRLEAERATLQEERNDLLEKMSNLQKAVDENSAAEAEPDEEILISSGQGDQ